MSYRHFHHHHLQQHYREIVEGDGNHDNITYTDGDIDDGDDDEEEDFIYMHDVFPTAVSAATAKTMSRSSSSDRLATKNMSTGGDGSTGRRVGRNVESHASVSTSVNPHTSGGGGGGPNVNDHHTKLEDGDLGAALFLPHIFMNGPVVTTLSGAEENYQAYYKYMDSNAKLLREIKSTRRWRWAFCCSCTLLTVLVMACVFVLVYSMVFRLPLIYVDNCAVTKLPGMRDRSIGFDITLHGLNSNLVNATVESVLLYASIVDVAVMRTYVINKPINVINSSRTLGAWQTTSLSLQPKLDLKDSSNWVDIYTAILSDSYGIRIDGKLTYRLGGLLSYTQRIRRYQQYINLNYTEQSDRDTMISPDEIKHHDKLLEMT